MRTSIEAGYLLANDDVEGLALVSNLGISGARADFPVEVPVSADLTLRLPAQDEESVQRPLEVPCVVAWTIATTGDEPVPTGLKFSAMTDAVRDRLSIYLARLMA